MNIKMISHALAAQGTEHTVVAAPQRGVTYPASTMTRLKPGARSYLELQREDFRVKPKEGDQVLLVDGNKVFRCRLGTWESGNTATVWIPAIKLGKNFEDLTMTLKKSIYPADQEA